MSTKKQMMRCSNPLCHTSGRETEAGKLQACSRCRLTRYCSKECQRIHWNAHKPGCQMTVEHAESLENPLNPKHLVPLPDGITLKELDTRLEKWISWHNPTLMGATIHALSLPTDINRARTHVLNVTVRPRPLSEHGGKVSKYFKIITAEPLEVATAMTYSEPWPGSLVWLQNMREEQEASGRGTVAAIGVICKPLGVQIVPFGSLKGLSSLQVLPKWKETMINDTTNGKKFTRFGY